MTVAKSDSHEFDETDVCRFCGASRNGTYRLQYCSGKGYYTRGNPPGLKSRSAWKKLGYRVIKGQNPAGEVYAFNFPSDKRWYSVYSFFQCERIKP